MTESSSYGAASSSTLHSLVLRKVAGVKNLTVAQAIGHDEGHVSRICSGERGLKLHELEAFLTSLGLKVIECEGALVTMPAEKFQALQYLAREALQ